MQTAQIIPANIYPPKPGKTNYNVKDSTGTYYSTPPEVAASMVVGQPVIIHYESKPGQRDGRMVHFVKDAQIVGQAPVGQVIPAQTMPQQSVTIPPNPVPQLPIPQPQDLQSENIFITGVVGRAMGSGSFTIMDIPLLTKAARAAWRGEDYSAPPIEDYSAPPIGGQAFVESENPNPFQ